MIRNIFLESIFCLSVAAITVQIQIASASAVEESSYSIENRFLEASQRDCEKEQKNNPKKLGKVWNQIKEKREQLKKRHNTSIERCTKFCSGECKGKKKSEECGIKYWSSGGKCGCHGGKSQGGKPKGNGNKGKGPGPRPGAKGKGAGEPRKPRPGAEGPRAGAEGKEADKRREDGIKKRAEKIANDEGIPLDEAMKRIKENIETNQLRQQENNKKKNDERLAFIREKQGISSDANIRQHFEGKQEELRQIIAEWDALKLKEGMEKRAKHMAEKEGIKFEDAMEKLKKMVQEREQKGKEKVKEREEKNEEREKSERERVIKEKANHMAKNENIPIQDAIQKVTQMMKQKDEERRQFIRERQGIPDNVDIKEFFRDKGEEHRKIMKEWHDLEHKKGMEEKAKHMAEKEGISFEDAKAKMKQKDEERKKFIRERQGIPDNVDIKVFFRGKGEEHRKIMKEWHDLEQKKRMEERAKHMADKEGITEGDAMAKIKEMIQRKDKPKAKGRKKGPNGKKRGKGEDGRKKRGNVRDGKKRDGQENISPRMLEDELEYSKFELDAKGFELDAEAEGFELDAEAEGFELDAEAEGFELDVEAEAEGILFVVKRTLENGTEKKNSKMKEQGKTGNNMRGKTDKRKPKGKPKKWTLKKKKDDKKKPKGRKPKENPFQNKKKKCEKCNQLSKAMSSNDQQDECSSELSKQKQILACGRGRNDEEKQISNEEIEGAALKICEQQGKKTERQIQQCKCSKLRQHAPKQKQLHKQCFKELKNSRMKAKEQAMAPGVQGKNCNLQLSILDDSQEGEAPPVLKVMSDLGVGNSEFCGQVTLVEKIPVKEQEKEFECEQEKKNSKIQLRQRQLLGENENDEDMIDGATVHQILLSVPENSDAYREKYILMCGLDGIHCQQVEGEEVMESMKQATGGVDWETTEVEANDQTGDRFQIGEVESNSQRDSDNTAYNQLSGAEKVEGFQNENEDVNHKSKLILYLGIGGLIIQFFGGWIQIQYYSSQPPVESIEERLSRFRNDVELARPGDIHIHDLEIQSKPQKNNLHLRNANEEITHIAKKHNKTGKKHTTKGKTGKNQKRTKKEKLKAQQNWQETETASVTSGTSISLSDRSNKSSRSHGSNKSSDSGKMRFEPASRKKHSGSKRRK